MVLSATQARVYTNTSTQIHNRQDLDREVTLTENAIRDAGRMQRYNLIYNAQIIGNPHSDPAVDANLSALQIQYRDLFVGAGYEVFRDEDTGYWLFSWAEVGAESMVGVYSIRTTVTPGPVQDDTVEVVEGYFASLPMPQKVRVALVGIDGGDIPESDFGATNSVFYEYVAVVEKRDDADHSDTLTQALIDTMSNYATGNVKTYKVA